jgi:hypothetical protein
MNEKGSDRVKELLRPPEKYRYYTLNADQETFQIVRRVAQETGRTCPKVLAAFVEVGYAAYLREKSRDGKGKK